MKKAIVIILAVTQICNSMAQMDEIKPEVSVGLNFGFSTLNLPSSNVDFSFTDESPSQDYISSQFNLPKIQRPFTIKPYLNYFDPSGWQIEANAELGIGDGTSLYGLNLALFRKVVNKPNNRFANKIGLQVGGASADLFLGNIYQNDLYIEINGFEYYDKYVTVSYKESQLVFSPVYQFDMYVGSNALLRFNIGYKLPFGVTNNAVVFSGDKDLDGNPHIEEVAMSYRDMEFKLNDKIVTRKIFNQKGVFADLGFALTF